MDLVVFIYVLVYFLFMSALVELFLVYLLLLYPIWALIVLIVIGFLWRPLSISYICDRSLLYIRAVSSVFSAMYSICAVSPFYFAVIFCVSSLGFRIWRLIFSYCTLVLSTFFRDPDCFSVFFIYITKHYFLASLSSSLVS